MIPKAFEIMKAGIKEGVEANIIVNNRVGGNTPLIASEIVKNFL